MDEATQAQIKQNNEDIRKEREKIIDSISYKFSCFKRDFIGAPMRRAMKSLAAGKIQSMMQNSFIDRLWRTCLFSWNPLQIWWEVLGGCCQDWDYRIVCFELRQRDWQGPGKNISACIQNFSDPYRNFLTVKDMSKTHLPLFIMTPSSPNQYQQSSPKQ